MKKSFRNLLLLSLGLFSWSGPTFACTTANEAYTYCGSQCGYSSGWALYACVGKCVSEIPNLCKYAQQKAVDMAKQKLANAPALHRQSVQDKKGLARQDQNLSKSSNINLESSNLLRGGGASSGKTLTPSKLKTDTLSTTTITTPPRR